MIRIGKIETTDSIIYRTYEVIDIDGKMYAGKDAFSWPELKYDLRSMECIVLPGEWRWIERIVIKDKDSGLPPVAKGKYNVISGNSADIKLSKVLKKYEVGFLCLQEEGQPYAVPMNHIFLDGKLYLHGSGNGKMVQIAKINPTACYTVYGQAENEPKQVRSCHLQYESAILYGNLRTCQDDEEKKAALRALSEQYGAPFEHGFEKVACIMALDLSRATVRDGRFKPGQLRNIYISRPAGKGVCND